MLRKFPRQWLGAILAVIFVAGCNGDDASPTSPSAAPVNLAAPAAPAAAAAAAAVGSSGAANAHPAGTLTNLAGACPNVTFMVSGTMVRTSASTVFDDGGCAALRNGDQVRIDGVRQPDGSVQATEVEVDASENPNPPDDGPDIPDVHPAGTLSNLGGSCPNVTFTVNGTVVSTSAATVFDDGGCAALRNGDQVRVDAVRQPDGSVRATEVEVDASVPPSPPDDGPDIPDVHPAGTLSNLGGSCPNVTFTVNGTVVSTSAATVFDDGGCAALRNGDQVRVDAVRQPDGSVRATEIEVDEADDAGPEGIALALEIDPDEWRLEWAQGSQSGHGGPNLTAEIRGSGVERIAPGSVTLSGPAGAIAPASTDATRDDFEAAFAKIEAIAVVGGVSAGGVVTVTIRGELSDGTPFSLAQQVAIRK